MNCAQIEDVTADYLGNELGSEQREKFEVHLQSCDACRARIDEFQETLEELNRLAAVPLPTGAEKTSQLRTVRRRAPTRRMLIASLKAAAAVAFGVVIGRASVTDGRFSTTRERPAAVATAADSPPGVHPRWIELGREMDGGQSSFTSRLLLLAQAAERKEQS